MSHNQFYPYKSRKNMKRALGSNQRNVAPTKKAPTPEAASGTFLAAAQELLRRHQSR